MRTPRPRFTPAIGLVLLVVWCVVTPAPAQNYGPSSRRLAGVASSPARARSAGALAGARPGVRRIASRPGSLDSAWNQFASARASDAGVTRVSATRPSSAVRPSAHDPNLVVRSYFPQQAGHHTCTPSRGSLLARSTQIVRRAPMRTVAREEQAPPRRVESWGNR